MITAIALATVLHTASMAEPTSIYDFTMKSIDGKETKLKKYEGKVLLVVNVASK